MEASLSLYLGISSFFLPSDMSHPLQGTFTPGVGESSHQDKNE
jgi:hypothetical protein